MAFILFCLPSYLCGSSPATIHGFPHTSHISTFPPYPLHNMPATYLPPGFSSAPYILHTTTTPQPPPTTPYTFPTTTIPLPACVPATMDLLLGSLGHLLYVSARCLLPALLLRTHHHTTSGSACSFALFPTHTYSTCAAFISPPFTCNPSSVPALPCRVVPALHHTSPACEKHTHTTTPGSPHPLYCFPHPTCMLCLVCHLPPPVIPLPAWHLPLQLLPHTTLAVPVRLCMPWWCPFHMFTAPHTCLTTIPRLLLAHLCTLCLPLPANPTYPSAFSGFTYTGCGPTPLQHRPLYTVLPTRHAG